MQKKNIWKWSNALTFHNFPTFLSCHRYIIIHNGRHDAFGGKDIDETLNKTITYIRKVIKNANPICPQPTATHHIYCIFIWSLNYFSRSGVKISRFTVATNDERFTFKSTISILHLSASYMPAEYYEYAMWCATFTQTTTVASSQQHKTELYWVENKK